MAEQLELQLERSRVQRPFTFLNPTKIYYTHSQKDGSKSAEGAESTATSPAIHYVWSSRNNRKGRHAIAIDPKDVTTGAFDAPAYSDTLESIAKNIWRMLTYYPIWDISWLGAYVFTIGSLVWVINGFLVFQPWTLDLDQSDVYWGGGVTAFLGATIYEIGSVFLMLEAINANRSGCFGWALERLITPDSNRTVVRATPSKHLCNHHHVNKKSLTKSTAQLGEKQRQISQPEHTAEAWTWWPSDDMVKNNLVHDLGFWASSAQMFGASIFWISGFTSLPGIFDNLSSGAMIGTYWVPQIVGGLFFVISGTLFMLETQKSLWKPEFRSLGWHIGFWNMVGGVGFTLCPIFGLYSAQWAQYQSSCSTFWGSWAFLIGSVIQWYESLSKHPVERRRT